MMPLCRHNDSLLLLLDVSILKHKPQWKHAKDTLKNLQQIRRAAGHFEIPVIRSRLRPNAADKTKKPVKRIDRDAFSCCAEPALFAAMVESHKRQIILAGSQTHISILQSAFDLQKHGFEVFVVADAVCAHQPLDHRIALERIARQGIHVTTTAALIHEWLASQSQSRLADPSAGTD